MWWRTCGCIIRKIARRYDLSRRCGGSAGVYAAEMASARAADSVCSLPPTRGGGGGGGRGAGGGGGCAPPPCPSPARGGGDDVAPPSIVVASLTRVRKEKLESTSVGNDRKWGGT